MKVKAFLSENRIPIILAISLLLFICHYKNQPFVEYVPLFQVGIFALWFTVGFLIVNRWKQIKEVGLGPKYIWIPLAVIVGSAVLRLIVQQDLETVVGALFIASMFGLYVVSRIYGEKTLKLFMPIVIIGAASIIIQTIVTHQAKNPGLFNNYATAAQFLVFGWLVSPKKHQWWLSALVLAALFCTGAEEAILYVGVIGLTIVIRKDWSKKLLLPVSVFGVLLLVCSITGVTQVLWGRAYSMAYTTYQVLTDDSLTPEEKDLMMNEATNLRWREGWRVHRPISPLGYGVNITYHYRGIPHNIILLVTDQLGPVAACAWMSCMIIGIRKTKWKYGFLALILFGVFQPFVWTEMAPYMWCMAGAATVSERSSYVFRGVVWK